MKYIRESADSIQSRQSTHKVYDKLPSLKAVNSCSRMELFHGVSAYCFVRRRPRGWRMLQKGLDYSLRNVAHAANRQCSLAIRIDLATDMRPRKVILLLEDVISHR